MSSSSPAVDFAAVAGPSTAPDQPEASSQVTNMDTSGFVSMSQVSSVVSLSPQKQVLETPKFVKPFLKREIYNRATRFFFMAFLFIKLDAIKLFFGTRLTKKSFFGSYESNGDTIGFGIIDLVEPIKKDDLKKDLANERVLVNSPCLILPINDPFNLFKFVTAKATLAADTLFEKIEKIGFVQKKLTDYARARNIKRVDALIYEYTMIGENISSDLAQKYPEHYENAVAFLSVFDPHRCAVSAMKIVQSIRNEDLQRMSNYEYVCKVSKEFYDYWCGPDFDGGVADSVVALAELTIRLHGECKIKNIIKTAFQTFQFQKPKNRWICLSGPYNSGKTSIANALKKVFSGTSININLSDDTRRGFQLGMAIGHRYVVFDDVTSIGWRIADQYLRDYFDGHTEVGLEKKGCNPYSQIFPPGCITTNDTCLPEALQQRIKLFKLVPNPKFVKDHEEYFDVLFDQKVIYTCK